jgi:uncharacterized NTF2-like protein DUF6841
MKNEIELVERTYRAYFTVFQMGNPRAITPYWHTPSLFVSPAGNFALTNVKEAEQFFERLIYAMRQTGYARSVLTSVHVKQLADDLALVHARGDRFTKEGDLLERMSGVYTMRLTDETWRIASAVMIDPECALQLV